jgi:hypothetical protein
MRRITITYNIEPLTREETGAYIQHRLKVAGADHEIFSAGAVEEVFDFSNGFPRQINIISDLAMFFSSQLDQRTVNRKVVRQCRDRISFTIADVPAKPQQRPAAASGSPPSTAPAQPRSTFSRMWMVIAIVIAVGAGVYFAMPEWKSRLRQWIQEIGQTEEKPSQVSAVPLGTGRDAAAPSEEAAEAVDN